MGGKKMFFGNIDNGKDDFVFTIDTTKPGVTDSNSFRVPNTSGNFSHTFNGSIDWGDGFKEFYNYQAPSIPVISHTYAIPGIYQIRIKGVFEYAWNFANEGDKLKLISVEQWGANSLAGQNTAHTFMKGCSNLDLSNCLDGFKYDLGVVTEFFMNCSSLTTIGNLDKWTSSNWGSSWGINNMFRGCVNLDDPLFSTWNLTGVSGQRNMSGFMNGVTLSTSTYDAWLINLSGQALQNGVNIGFGNSKYTLGGSAEAARNYLISHFGWTITDGGGI